MNQNMMNIHPYGDCALLINFEQRIAPEINARVIDLNEAIDSAGLPGITFCIPAYCSLTVGYDPMVVRFETLREQITVLAQGGAIGTEYRSSRQLKIPVCYEQPYALDFTDVSRQNGLSREEIIALHTATKFRVYMLGFLPGFAYMGRLPEALFCSRKTTPRLRVPAQSVGLAGFQTGIYPTEAPGGWQIIGRTPLKVFDGAQEDPFLFRPGDEVVFEAISAAEFERIEN
jgi:inhibitor of KinA